MIGMLGSIMLLVNRINDCRGTATIAASTVLERRIAAAMLDHSISFEPSDAQLSSAATASLQRLLPVLKSMPTSRWAVVAFAGEGANIVARETLASKRSQAVVGYFVAQGLSPQRFTSRGVALNANGAADDRVEFVQVGN